MKNSFIIFLVFIALPLFVNAQKTNLDSLQHALTLAQTDSARFRANEQISDFYSESNWKQAMVYLDNMYNIAAKNKHHYDEATALDAKAYCLMQLGKFPQSFTTFQQALKLAEDDYPGEKVWETYANGPNSKKNYILASIHHDLGHLMGAANNISQQIAEYLETRNIAEHNRDTLLLGFVNMNLGHVYQKLGKVDSALMMETNAETIFKQQRNYKYLCAIYRISGLIYNSLGNSSLSKAFFYKGIKSGIENLNLSTVSECYSELTKIYLSARQTDSALYCAKQSLLLSKKVANDQGPFTAALYENLYKVYELGENRDSAYKYLKLALAAKDTAYNTNVKNLSQFEALSFKNQVQLQQLEQEKEVTQTRLQIGVLIAGIVVLLLIAGISYRNSRQQQKANNLLQEQKEEIETQRDNLGQALAELKTTQTQLIQSEKLASLGELTAGIAHEIQNPLNFVNNFSDVNRELIDELRDSLKRNDIDDALSIADDIQQNEEKVNHHGKRADAIVKNMLQHSRNNSGEKELTDINSMSDEYLRLSYHGLRAKDKLFNAEMATDFDENLPKISVIPQDVGRVLLNLFNNAFYAVQQKKKTATGDYRPLVKVSTALKGNFIEIKVSDNGTGIPADVKEKILQPFFTTKPTGEGTGLGLSLSYDIVIKGHGGNIEVNSKEGEGSEFIILLPID